MPLRFHFNGSIFYEGAGRPASVVPCPWDRSIRFEMPVEAWRRMIAEHHPDRRLDPARERHARAARRRKAETGAPTFDALVAELLDDAAGGAR